MTAITTLPVVFPRTWPIIIHGLGSLNASAPLRLEQAKMQAQQANAKLEAYWASLRVAHARIPVLVSCLTHSKIQFLRLKRVHNNQPDLKQALAIILGPERERTGPNPLRLAATRTCNYLIGIAGNKLLGDYTRADALKFREWLIDRGLTGSSVTRNFSYLKAVFNFAVSEYALDVTNPFIGVYHDRQAGVIKRQPIPIENIKRVRRSADK